MASSGLVQSACIAITPGVRKADATGSRSSTRVLLALQVRHQSAVTSKNTISPCETCRAIAARSNAVQFAATRSVGSSLCDRRPERVRATIVRAKAADPRRTEDMRGKLRMATMPPLVAETAQTD